MKTLEEKVKFLKDNGYKFEIIANGMAQAITGYDTKHIQIWRNGSHGHIHETLDRVIVEHKCKSMENSEFQKLLKLI